VIGGYTAYEVVGNFVTLTVAEVNNMCDLGVSGSLRLDLWATATPYLGGTIIGYKFGSVSLSPLTGGYSHLNIYDTVPFVRPPDGTYYVTLTLSEYDGGAYMITDYLNYSTRWTLGTPPAVPTSKPATQVTSAGFTANWGSASTATGYYLDVSTSSAFNTFVYQNRDVGNTLLATVAGLSAATPYFYRVRAYNAAGVSGYSSTIAVTTTVNAPAAPIANSATSVTTNSFTAWWGAASGATGYRLDVSASSSFSSFLSGYHNLDVGNVLTRSVSGLSAGTPYYYRVCAYNAGGTSAYSGVISVVTLVNPPSSPTVSPASSITSSGFTANWGAVATANGYRIDVSRSSTFSSFLPGYQDLDVGNALSVAVTGLTASTAHYYRVRAYNAGGTSPNSARITATTLVNPPAAPVAKAASSITATRFTAGWNSATGATGYRLDVSSNSAFSTFLNGYQNLDLGNVLSRSVAGLSAGTSYYYRVRAYNAGGTSSSSATITATTAVTTPPPPTASPPSSITVNTFTANWAGASMAAGYRLDVSSSSTFSSYLTGYQNLDVGNVLSRTVTGLNPGATYYYRVRAYNTAGTSANSGTISGTTSIIIPSLTCEQQSGKIVVSWPTNATGFTLQSLSDPRTLAWTNATPSPVIVNGKFTVTNSMAGKLMLYRLKK
jgi:phosphodiesterase/alkaline phosphatase D-like protein